ncbi:MAG: acyltransferase family protein [Pseudomonadota bacterium]
MRSKRLAGIDLIRIAALLAIVVGHAYPDNELVDRLLQSWRLPIFFVLTGYFWSAPRTINQELLKRGNSLLVPYAIWGVLLTLAAWLLFNDDPFTTAQRFLLAGAYAVQPFNSFWFFTALFAAVIATRFLDLFGSAMTWPIAALGLLANIFAGPQLASVPWSIATASGALIFIQSGRLLAALSGSFSRKNILLASLATVLGCLILVALIPGDFEPLKMKVGIFPPFATLVSLVMCMSLVSLGTTIDLADQYSRLVSKLSLPSFVVIVLHPLFIILLSGKMPYFLVPILAFIGALTLGVLIAQTRARKILTGVD